MLTIDFETEGVVGNPIYAPPKPVGVSIKLDGEPSQYWAWGHPTENNCNFDDARRKLRRLLTFADREPDGWLGHNAPFECAVLREYFGYTPKDPLKVHDTQYLIFLHDPYAYNLGLKPSAERVLGMPPDEQDALRDWVMRNVPEAKKSDWGAYICRAPAGLAGRYACGDTDRTWLLYQHLRPRIEEQGMLEAYQREQRLSPIMSRSSQVGVRLDVDKLAQDLEVYTQAKQLADDYLHKRLGDFNIDSDAELAAALDKAGVVTEWVLTPTGKHSTARKNLAGRVSDPDIVNSLAYRGVLSTCLGTFAGPWLAQAAREGGRLHPQWNQVRGDKGVGGDMSGARTGRKSCKEPNLQNIPNEFDGIVTPAAVRKYLEKLARAKKWNGHDIIHMRDYILPDEGHVWLKRDFSAQEMRIMAHFAEGKLFEAFIKDPTTDPHLLVKSIIDSMTGGDMERKHVKITGFGIMYGRGIANLADALGLDYDGGRRTRDAYFQALPEVNELSKDIRQRGRTNRPIRTWGGRIYYREPHPQRDLSYKLLNYLIQGSAADQTKQSVIDWDAAKEPDDVFMADVHDELNISAPAEPRKYRKSMKTLEREMNKDRFDVPFLSEGYIGSSWGTVTAYEE